MSGLTQYDRYSAEALHEAGLKAIRWEMTKAGMKLGGGFGGIYGTSMCGLYWFVSFMFPGAGVMVWLGIGTIVLIVEAAGAWEMIIRDTGIILYRWQELRVIRAIQPIVARWRNGAEVNSSDRHRLFQLRVMISAQLERYKEESEDWRIRGRLRKSAAMIALMHDLDDAKKILDLGFARAEQEIRPRRAEPAIAVTPAPVGQPALNNAGSVLNRYRKTALVRRSDDTGRN